MATRYYGVDFGGDIDQDVTESGSTTSKDVELVVVYTDTNNSKLQLLRAIKALEMKIQKETWPPA